MSTTIPPADTKTQRGGLGDRVHAILSEDDASGASIGCGAEPAGIHPTDRERRLRDWGMVYGIAFGLAISEQPDRDGEELAREALGAARGAWARWAGISFPPRPVLSQVVDDALVAFDQAEIELWPAIYGCGTIAGSVRVRALCARMNSLCRAVGLPDDEVSE
jgi:hypothetical protein